MTLTLDEMVERFARHGAAELAGDIEATIATLTSTPWYEFYPVDVRVSGRDAIREAYRLIHARFHPRYRGQTPSVHVAGGDHVLIADGHSDLECLDGVVRPVWHCAVVVFDETGLIEGERVYTSLAMSAALEHDLGEAFFAFPGVERR